MGKKKAAPEVGLIQVEAEPIKKEIATVSTEALALRVNSDQTYKKAGDILGWCRVAKREVELVFDPIVKATRAAWKTAVAQRDGILEPVEKVDKHLREEVKRYAERKESERQIAEANLLAARQANEARLEAGEEVEFNPAPQAAREIGVPEVDGLGFRDGWGFKILNEALIPREYLVVDETKIRKVVEALGQASAIPGVEVFSKKIPVVR